MPDAERTEYVRDVAKLAARYVTLAQSIGDTARRRVVIESSGRNPLPRPHRDAAIADAQATVRLGLEKLRKLASEGHHRSAQVEDLVEEVRTAATFIGRRSKRYSTELGKVRHWEQQGERDALADTTKRDAPVVGRMRGQERRSMRDITSALKAGAKEVDERGYGIGELYMGLPRVSPTQLRNIRKGQLPPQINCDRDGVNTLRALLVLTQQRWDDDVADLCQRAGESMQRWTLVDDGIRGPWQAIQDLLLNPGSSGEELEDAEIALAAVYTGLEFKRVREASFSRAHPFATQDAPESAGFEL